MSRKTSNSRAADSPVALPPHVTREWLRRVRRGLLAWFARHARDLPWRRTHDPYAVWVSEIMLQQTQVATVIGYFERFLARFPTIAALAAADEHEVLRLWEGLGYYRRARQLHAAAQEIVERHRGVFPTGPAAVQQLPGIGRYTAGAILSIAFDQPAPIVEANTQRLFSRLLAEREDPRQGAAAARLWRLAELLLPARGAGQVNQALMELGALVCTPQSPACDECPLASRCPTFAANLQAEIPSPTRRVQYEEVIEGAVVLRRRERVLMRLCQPGQRWAGLWDFPRTDSLAGSPPTVAAGRELAAAALHQRLCDLLDEPFTELQHRATIKHGVTRFRITLHCFEATCAGRRRPSAAALCDQESFRWFHRDEVRSLALSTTGRQIAERILFL